MLLHGLASSLLGLRVFGQTSNATCNLNSTTSWLFNEFAESPCVVWAKVQSLCIPSQSFINVPPLLNPAFGYTLPSNSSPCCDCNVVSYNLMAGCSWCQVGESNSWANEGQWEAACGGSFNVDRCSVTLDGMRQPNSVISLGFAESAVSLPSYAWHAWQGEQWMPSPASSAATSYATITPTGTTTLSRSFPAPTTTFARPSTSSSSSQPDPSSSSSSASTSASASTSTSSKPSFKTKIVIGAVVGGIFALIVLLLLWRSCRSPRRTAPQDVNFRYRETRRNTLARATSIFNVFGTSSSRKGAAVDPKRWEAELMNDPKSFNAPRPAPQPSNESLQYITTTQRLKAQRGSDDSLSPLSPMLRGGVLQNHHLSAASGALLFEDEEEKGQGHWRHNEVKLRKDRGSPHPFATDFSQPRPDSPVQTLPSIYQPRTDASVFTNRDGWSDRWSVPNSPESKYPMTFYDRDSNVDEVQGGGRRNIHSRLQEATRSPLPR